MASVVLPYHNIHFFPRRPLREPGNDLFNVSIMFYRSKVLDYGYDENLNICTETPAVPSAFTDVSPK